MNPKSQTLIISMKKIHEGEDVDRGLTSKGMESQFGPCGWQEVELQQNQLKRRAGEGKKEDGTLGMSYLLLSRPSFSHLENGTSHHP